MEDYNEDLHPHWIVCLSTDMITIGVENGCLRSEAFDEIWLVTRTDQGNVLGLGYSGRTRRAAAWRFPRGDAILTFNHVFIKGRCGEMGR